MVDGRNLYAGKLVTLGVLGAAIAGVGAATNGTFSFAGAQDRAIESKEDCHEGHRHGTFYVQDGGILNIYACGCDEEQEAPQAIRSQRPSVQYVSDKVIIADIETGTQVIGPLREYSSESGDFAQRALSRRSQGTQGTYDVFINDGDVEVGTVTIRADGTMSQKDRQDMMKRDGIEDTITLVERDSPTTNNPVRHPVMENITGSYVMGLETGDGTVFIGHPDIEGGATYEAVMDTRTRRENVLPGTLKSASSLDERLLSGLTYAGSEYDFRAGVNQAFFSLADSSSDAKALGSMGNEYEYLINEYNGAPGTERTMAGARYVGTAQALIDSGRTDSEISDDLIRRIEYSSNGITGPKTAAVSAYRTTMEAINGGTQ